MNMIEKVARAIDKAGQKSSENEGLKGVGLCFDPTGSEENRKLMLKLSKAAIAAMREPSEEMEAEAKEMNKLLGLDHINAASGCYKRMIDAALKE